MPAEGVNASTASPGWVGRALTGLCCIGYNSHGLSVGQGLRRPSGSVFRIAEISGKTSTCAFANPSVPAAFQVGWERHRKSQSGGDHVRRSDEPLGYSVFRLSRHAVAFWSAMGVERSLAQYRISRSHPTMFVSDIVWGCMRCLWAGCDSHLCAGADLDCFGIAYGYFGGVRLLQIRALASARPRRRWG
jgi:hypothetical protein